MEERYYDTHLGNTLRTTTFEPGIQVFGEFEIKDRLAYGKDGKLVDLNKALEPETNELENLLGKNLMAEEKPAITEKTKDYTEGSIGSNPSEGMAIFETDVKDINFVQVVPDSQFFVELAQIAEYARAKGDRYLFTGINNTIERGYRLLHVPEVQKTFTKVPGKYYGDE